jgi:hypothetical protein
MDDARGLRTALRHIDPSLAFLSVWFLYALSEFVVHPLPQRLQQMGHLKKAAEHFLPPCSSHFYVFASASIASIHIKRLINCRHTSTLCPILVVSCHYDMFHPAHVTHAAATSVPLAAPAPRCIDH